MSIQPGVGYTFTASSLGHNLNIEQPWTRLDYSEDTQPQQFEVRKYSGVDKNVAAIQIAKGAVNFDQSNMPEVWGNPSTSRRQIYMQKVAVGPGVTATSGGIADGLTKWMDMGGFYTLPGDGFYYVTISKMDIDGGLTAGGVTDSALIQTNRPFVSVFKSDNAIYDKIFQQTGPSQYVNRMNVERMSGYDKESTGLDYDFGACHTTWFNPVKYGYDCKIIATIDVSTVTVDDVATKVLDIRQHVVGSIDINIPLQYLGSNLYVEEGASEATDPYNINEENQFLYIVNSDLRSTMNSITPLTTDFFTDMLGPYDWTATSYNFDQDCSGYSCAHPFHVRKEASGSSFVFKVCTGSVNNIVPSNIAATFSSGNGYIYIVCTNDGASNYPYEVTLAKASSIPADTDSTSYIGIAQIVTGNAYQLVSSSLWTERFKCGSTPAKYWWSNV